MPTKAVFIEDDEDIRDLVLYALKSHDFLCEGFESGEPFFRALEKGALSPDIILLDVMLPVCDGFFILKKLRAHNRGRAIPVIMLSAKSSEFDKVKGLDLGADDYIAKPFGVTELVARVNAVLRRTGARGKEEGTLAYKGIALDSRRRFAAVDGQKMFLTFMEFELLQYLLLNTDIVLSRDKLMEMVWGQDFESESRTVDAHIKSLRQKMGEAGKHIKTIRNVGYKIGE
ncbi:MAG: response regulator transcription factor [Acidaminococcales bacterium]|jgi:two-component system alkaline phosphatase synthesis response regulator PhoP|nr:response regulator transcription factor [Acidaminococcales bacterium]